MKTVLLLFTLLSPHSQAKELAATVNAKIIDLEKACVEQQFGKPVCSCVSRNLKSQAQAGSLSESQLAAAVVVMQKTVVPDGQKTTEYEHMADFLAGLQFHCHEKPKYSID